MLVLYKVSLFLSSA